MIASLDRRDRLALTLALVIVQTIASDSTWSQTRTTGDQPSPNAGERPAASASGKFRLRLTKLKYPGLLSVRCYSAPGVKVGYDGGCFGAAEPFIDTADCNTPECVVEKDLTVGAVTICCDLWNGKYRWTGYRNEVRAVVKRVEIVPEETRTLNLECIAYSGFTAKQSYLKEISK